MRYLILVFALANSCLAQMQYPLDVVADNDGIMYVADLKLPGIWKIQDGKLSVFFQADKKFRTPLNAVRCLAVAEDGTLYAGDSATREVYKFDAEGKPVPLTEGYVGIPSDLLIHDGSIYAADLETQRVWKFPLDGGEPEEAAILAGVRGLAWHPDGKLLCATTLENPLRTVNEDGTLEILLKDRPFQLNHHIDILDGNLYVADNYASTIWKVNLSGEPKVEAFAKGAPLNKPVGLSVHNGEILVADPHAVKIFRINAAGEISEVSFE